MLMAHLNLALSVLILIATGVGSYLSFFLLMSDKAEDQELQFVPVLFIVAFGMGITATGFSILRWRCDPLCDPLCGYVTPSSCAYAFQHVPLVCERAVSWTHCLMFV